MPRSVTGDRDVELDLAGDTREGFQMVGDDDADHVTRGADILVCHCSMMTLTYFVIACFWQTRMSAPRAVVTFPHSGFSDWPGRGRTTIANPRDVRRNPAFTGLFSM